MSVLSLLEDCVGQLDEPFRRGDIMAWFRRHHPEVRESTLSVYIQAVTENSGNQNHPHLSSRPALLRRVEHGLYVLAGGQASASRSTSPQDVREKTADAPQTEVVPSSGSDLILVGCVQTKRPTASPAQDLFDSPLFAGRRRYATGAGRPWYILSAKYGLLAPDDVIGPYDVYLADQSAGYRRSWGEFVVAQLARYEPSLRDRVIEVHAGAAYVEPLRRPLSAQGVQITTPLAHLGLGEQLAWYAREPVRTRSPGIPSGQSMPSRAHLSPAESTVVRPTSADAGELIHSLTDREKALSPAELLALDRSSLMVPGLYTWWVDERGAADLSAGLESPVPAGMIYAGQAGATRWPSGRRSGNTLWSRIAGMHLGGSAEFSTFRRSLAAVLRTVLDLRSENDPALSAWIGIHLRVIAVPVPDADRLGEFESAVLDVLDPPLNLRGREPTALRERLSELRRQRNA